MTTSTRYNNLKTLTKTAKVTLLHNTDKIAYSLSANKDSQKHTQIHDRKQKNDREENGHPRV